VKGAVHSACLASARGWQPEGEIREAQAAERAREGEGAVDVLRDGSFQPLVLLILAAELHRVASVGPDEGILEGIDAVVPGGIVGVAAAKWHGDRKSVV